jgi:hypothetical protein
MKTRLGRYILKYHEKTKSTENFCGLSTYEYYLLLTQEKKRDKDSFEVIISENQHVEA